MGDTLAAECSGKACGYGVYSLTATQADVDMGMAASVGDSVDVVGCDDGSGSCWTADLVEADLSSFHTEKLQNATRKMIDALKEIGPGPKGTKLSFVHTTEGTMLAWVGHGGKFPKDALTIDSKPGDLKRALKIKQK